MDSSQTCPWAGRKKISKLYRIPRESRKEIFWEGRNGGQWNQTTEILSAVSGCFMFLFHGYVETYG